MVPAVEAGVGVWVARGPRVLAAIAFVPIAGIKNPMWLANLVWIWPAPSVVPGWCVVDLIITNTF